MPELPDITVYVEALRRRVEGRVLEKVRVHSPSLLRTFDPPLEAAEGLRIAGVDRLGKRVVLLTEGGPALVVHLMIAGRLRWNPGGRPGLKRGRIDMAAFAFDTGTLTLTEASTVKRATLHCVRPEGLGAFRPGGLDVLTCTPEGFAAVMRGATRTLKRALTDPRVLDGIGNAYSDEILHAARLSPTQRTSNLSEDELRGLHAAAVGTLLRWTGELLREFGLNDPAAPGRFPGPGEVTAFRPGFAVHGRYQRPCPACGASVQRIVYAENECNYCPVCQTGGRLLADRSLSRLLKDDWPRTVEELEGS
ncbi:MAG: DNA-formamidopyrimidine glycosylase family protein [Phycisphaerales bacterium]